MKIPRRWKFRSRGINSQSVIILNRSLKCSCLGKRFQLKKLGNTSLYVEISQLLPETLNYVTGSWKCSIRDNETEMSKETSSNSEIQYRNGSGSPHTTYLSKFVSPSNPHKFSFGLKLFSGYIRIRLLVTASETTIIKHRQTCWSFMVRGID